MNQKKSNLAIPVRGIIVGIAGAGVTWAMGSGTTSLWSLLLSGLVIGAVIGVLLLGSETIGPAKLFPYGTPVVVTYFATMMVLMPLFIWSVIRLIKGAEYAHDFSGFVFRWPAIPAMGLLVAIMIIFHLWESLTTDFLHSDQTWGLKTLVRGLGAFGFFFGMLFVAWDLIADNSIRPGRATFSPSAMPVMLAAWVGIESALWTWASRRERRAALAASPELRDVRLPADWDLPTNGFAEKSSNGYPMYLWREEADNRLGLSRPRWCRIVERDGELRFEFFDPVANRLPLQNWLAALVISAAVGIAGFLTLINYYSALKFAGIVLLASFAMTILAAAGTVVVTWGRWANGRFRSDGRIWSRPFADLLAFEQATAPDLEIRVDGERAKSGYGLIATFNDGTMWILTANTWSKAAIVGHHSALTRLFREPRETYIAAFVKRTKAQAASPEASSSSPGRASPVTSEGIPDRL